MKSERIPVKSFSADNGFIGKVQKLVREEVLPYQYKILNDAIPDIEKSHAIENIRLAAEKLRGKDVKPDEFYGMVFQDSDVAKGIEAAAYALAAGEDPELEKAVDETVRLYGASQHEDGYVDSYFTVKCPDKTWTNIREAHELYCAGHMMEAAVAYYEVTGKRELLDIMSKNADCIYEQFMKKNTRACPGHPEVELALMRLWRATGNEKYKELAKHFVDVRGQAPNYFIEEEKNRGWNVWNGTAELNTDYTQSTLPVREQKDAVGHAGRAVYLYTGMADVAKETQDETLLTACRNLWESITKRRMYITGGIGSTFMGEAFTVDYDLPNDRMYCESCASIGLMMFGQRMARLTRDASYYETVERALCNTVLAGVSAAGDRYFYVNPLEVWPENCKDHTSIAYVKPVRQPWFEVACCPANIARTLASLGQYIYAVDERSLYVNLLIGSEIETRLRGTDLHVSMENDLMQGGGLKLHVTSSGEHPIVIRLRVPHWMEQPVFRLDGEQIQPALENGYAVLAVNCTGTHVFTVQASVPVHTRAANLNVRADVGKVALQKGPFVYCVEQQDNGENLAALQAAASGAEEVPADAALPGGIPTLRVPGRRIVQTAADPQALYADSALRTEPCELLAVPYALWGNRTPGEMRVWIQR